MKNYLILFILQLLFIGCDSTNNPDNHLNGSFGIYLLKDRDISVDQIKDADLNQLDIESIPWLSSDDIKYYDMSSSLIYLQKNRSELFRKEFHIKMNGPPFVIAANNKRCVLGCFHSSLLSTIATTPFIDETYSNIYPEDILHIFNLSESQKINCFESALLPVNKIRRGLELSINDINVINNSDSNAAVQYTYTLKNNDKDGLYVIDPDKMGSNLFHYFVIGVSLHNENINLSSDYKDVEKPQPYNNWKPEWFIKIESGSRIQRSVILNGFPYIPDGSYNCRMHFFNPLNISKEKRELPDGRYWMGSVSAECNKDIY